MFTFESGKTCLPYPNCGQLPLVWVVCYLSPFDSRFLGKVAVNSAHTVLLSDTAHVCQRFIKWAFSESEQFQVVRSARAEAPEIRKVVCVLEMGIGLCVEREVVEKQGRERQRLRQRNRQLSSGNIVLTNSLTKNRRQQAEIREFSALCRVCSNLPYMYLYLSLGASSAFLNIRLALQQGK